MLLYEGSPLLDVGQTVRYRGLGAGRVLRHVTRPFAGEDRIFAVLYFEHSALEAQIPLGDPMIASKVEAVLRPSTLRKILRSIQTGGEKLQRTWDAREEEGERATREGGPREWATLLASYAWAEGHGVAVAASDEELVRKAIDLLASEIACSFQESYEEALERVEGAYEEAVSSAALNGGRKSESFVGANEALSEPLESF